MITRTQKHKKIVIVAGELKFETLDDSSEEFRIQREKQKANCRIEIAEFTEFTESSNTEFSIVFIT